MYNTVVTSKKILGNDWFDIVDDLILNQYQEKLHYFYLSKKPTVFIIPRDNKGNIFMIGEYRHPIRKMIWQLPAGMIEKGTSLSAAKRELFEETGLKSKIWKKLGEFYVAPGHENTKIIIYTADNVTTMAGVKKLGEQNEDIVSLKSFSLEDVLDKIRTGKIECGITIASIAKLKFGEA